MEKIKEILNNLGISKVKLAKYLGVSRQMVYNYLELDDINKWPKEKKILLFKLLNIEDGEDTTINNIKVNTDYMESVEARLNSTNKSGTLDLIDVKGLNKEEIMQVFRIDPFMITVKNNRLEALDKIYLEVLNLTKEELKNLIIKNPDTYIVSVSELNKNIDYLKEHNCTTEIIRNFLINNPQLVSMSPYEFKSVVKFN